MANWSTQAATRECQIAANGELTVVERLASLLETGQFADVTIRVGEGDDVVTFKAHRLLLATASQSLNNLFFSDAKNGPGEVSTLRVKDVDPDAFQHVLQYIYTDNLEICSAGESLTLLKLGKKWGLQNLMDKTVKYLDSFLNEYEPISEIKKNELCDLVVLTEEYGLPLKEKCWKVLLKNVNEVVPCQGFLNMSKDMLKRLFNHPDFQFKNQLVLFESIRDWGMNQVLLQNLSVNSLQGLIGEFLQFVDFKAIGDNDFLDTILPSDCLGKSELIAFFMSRGLEIPRDLAYNNNNISNSTMPYEKTGRFKRGYKLPNQEIYKEHELRFRVDKKLRLLGVGFGFLFSNTDMGITVHCQGPWETRQWRDIIQTYCRVSWEKMKTADVRLMFSEPVIIEPNHSYKVLVRVGRMSAGSSDVDLWGGTQGVSRLKMKDADFSFLKAAVDPSKEVQESDMENKPGMITDLFYELEDGSGRTTQSVFSPLKQEKQPEVPTYGSPMKKNSEVASIDRSESTNETEESRSNSARSRNPSRANNVADPGSPIDSPSPSIYSFRSRNMTSRVEDDPPSPTSAPPKKKSAAEEASSYYLAHKPSTIRGSETLPAFLRTRQPSTERSRPAWQIPFRTRISSATYNAYKPREPSTNRETSLNRDTSTYPSRRSSNQSSSIFDNSPLSKYSQGISSVKNKYESSSPSSKTSTRKGYEPTTSTSTSRYGTSGSRYGTSSTTSSSKPDSTYGSSSTQSRYTPSGSNTRYGTGSTGPSSSESKTTSRYGSGTSSSSRPERDSALSPTRFNTSSSLYRYGQSSPQGTGRDMGSSRSSGTSNSLSTSRYGTSSTLSPLGSSNRYASSTSGASGMSSNVGSSNKYGSSSSGISGGTSGSSSNKYEPSTSTSSGSSRYSSGSTPSSTTTSTSGTSSSLGSRYGSSSYSSPSYLSSSRFGTSSPIGKSYSGLSNRFGSSIYRR